MRKALTIIGILVVLAQLKILDEAFSLLVILVIVWVMKRVFVDFQIWLGNRYNQKRRPSG